MDTSEAKPGVFISYSHEDKKWYKDWLYPHLAGLDLAGHIDVWDDRQIDTGGLWRDEIKAAMERASVAVCLISEHYLASPFIVQEEVAYFLERCRENSAVMLPLFLDHCPWKYIDWLERIQMFPGGTKPLLDFTPRERKALFAEFAGKVADAAKAQAQRTPLESAPKMATFRGAIELPSVEVAAEGEVWTPAWPELPDSSVDIHRLPASGDELFGRRAELELLDEAWDSDSRNVVSFVAWGGVGKSALVNRWVARMGADNFRGAQRVFAWSFYSQGTGERVTTADMFVNEALIWFGDRETARSQMSAWDKGRRLAELVREEKTLLLLDGLEPLQSDVAMEPGSIKDLALAVLVKELAQRNPGLCVITTRKPVADIQGYPDAVIEKDLEQISPEAGRALLRVRGVRGTDTELEAVTRDFGCHALAIRLLAAYLQNEPGCHAHHAAAIPDLDIPVDDGRHPRRVMEAFAERFGDSIELQILSMVGLFDRPATAKEIANLRMRRTIDGLNDRIRFATDKEWDTAVAHLRQCGLLAPLSHHDEDFRHGVVVAQVQPEDLGGLDAHPLVREHFGERLRQRNEAAWRAGHSLLFECLQSMAPRLPDTLEKMEPLYRAVHHGCLAGRHQEALDKVHYPRIRRAGEDFSVHILGAFGADLAAVADLFEEPWSRPVSALREPARAYVLNLAGVCLRALGQLAEAATPTATSLEMWIQQKSWENAAQGAQNLSELRLILGDVAEAIAEAQRSPEYAEKSGNAFRKAIQRTPLADALHQAGVLAEAEALFREAEAMQEKNQPLLPWLHFLQGFQYCDLLLTRGQAKEVLKRATMTLMVAEPQRLLLPIALDHLSVGRARWALAEAGGEDSCEETATHLDAAVVGLRKSGVQDYLPRGLLARAGFRRFEGDYAAAARDLSEAMELATRCGMRLFETDAHLEYGRLYVAMAEAGEVEVPAGFEPGGAGAGEALLERARGHLDQAEALIAETGYHRRDGEAEALRAVCA